MSAILLNDAYYDLLKDGQVILDGIPVLKEVCLISFKAKAWLDLTERKENGESVDSRNIKKHKNDVFRLSQLIIAESRQALDEEVEADMKRFLNEMEKENIDLKALGIRGFSQESMINLFRNCYGIE